MQQLATLEAALTQSKAARGQLEQGAGWYSDLASRVAQLIHECRCGMPAYTCACVCTEFITFHHRLVFVLGTMRLAKRSCALTPSRQL